jgi:hypothetical protein
VIVLWDGRGTANDGKAYENSYAWFMKTRDGKVVDGTAFYDSISFNELWSRVQPLKHGAGIRSQSSHATPPQRSTLWAGIR